jgi:transposase-like protein
MPFVTQATAWFMLQRIRSTIVASGNSQLLGDAQIDETYIGGTHHDNKRGRGATGKTPVVGIVESKGELRMTATSDTKMRTIKPLIRKNVQIGSTVMTDEYRSYNGLSKDGYAHQRINHSAKQWVNEMVTTNAIEGVWKHLKAGIGAIYIHVSPKHLQLYCNEYQYRYNTREMDDFSRFEAWFGLCTGRLSYKELVGVTN